MKHSFETTVSVSNETKDRILDVAEHLFAEHGFAETSLRQITTRAKVNLAAVNYHFGSKEALIENVLRRKLGPINERRLELLDEMEALGPLTVEDVLRSFFQPVLEAGQGGVDLASFPKLLGRVLSDPDDRLITLFRDAFADVIVRYRGALAQVLPDAAFPLVALSIHFSLGAFVHLLTAEKMLHVMLGGRPQRQDWDSKLNNLVRFCASGARALAQGGQWR
jgi:AcrR family transcriptional regulator